MPQVPYTPYPDVVAREDPSAGPRIDAPGSAFGVNIGEAIERRLGPGFSEFGDDIFKQAINLQNLENETNARNQDAAYGLAQAKLHNDFIINNQGLLAKDALPKFLQDSDALRKQYREALPNEMAKKMFDASSLGFLLRNANSASLHAGSEFLKASNQSVTSGIDIKMRTRTDPFNDQEYQDVDDYITKESYKMQKQNGWSETERADFVLKFSQANRVSQLTEIGQTKPGVALDMLEKYKAEVGAHYSQLRDHLWAENRKIEGYNIAQDVIKSDPNASTEDLAQAVRERAEGLTHGDPNFVQAAENQLRSQLGHIRYQATIDKHNSINNLNDAIISGKFPDAKSLLDVPELAAAARTAGKDESWVQKGLDRHFKVEGEQFFRTFAQDFENLRGMSYEDREAFLGTDFWDKKYHLSDGEIKQLNAARKQVLKGDPLNFPQVNQIKRYMVERYSDELKAIGALQKNTAGRLVPGKNWNAFVGSIATGLDEFQEVNKRMPGPKDMEESFAKPLIAKHTEKGWFLDSQVPDILGPSAQELSTLTKQLTSDAKKAGVPAPTPNEIRRRADQEHWRDFFQHQQDLERGGK